MQLARPQVAALRLAGETGERFSRSETTTSKAICGWRGTRLVGATYGRWSCHRRQTRVTNCKPSPTCSAGRGRRPSRLGEGPASLARKARPEAAGLQIRRQLSRILPGLMATPRMPRPCWRVTASHRSHRHTRTSLERSTTVHLQPPTHRASSIAKPQHRHADIAVKSGLESALF